MPTTKKYRFVIVHGWAASPKMFWFPWLKKELVKQGHKVAALWMPTPIYPRIEEWVPYLKDVIKSPNERTVFVGHSIGCQTILRYIETLPAKTKVGPVILVAPFLELDRPGKDIAKPWLEVPMNIDKIKKHLTKIVAIFSDDDPLVPLKNKKHFSKHFSSKIVVLHGRNHFVTRVKFPELLKEINETL